MSLGADFLIGAAAGSAAAEITKELHNNPETKQPEQHLIDIHQTLMHIASYFKKQQEIRDDKWETIMLSPTSAAIVRSLYNYKHVYILITTPCVLTLGISGQGTFSWTPNIGLNIWKYPEGTTILLVTPSQPLLPVNFLFTDDESVQTGTSNSSIQNVNITQQGGIPTQMGNSGAATLTNAPEEVVGLWNVGSGITPWASAQFDGMNRNNVAAVASFQVNPTGGLDIIRGNQDSITLLTQTAAGSGTTSSTNQVNFNGRGVKVYLNITAIGTGTVTITIQGFDPIANTAYTLLVSAAIGAVGFTVLELYPGLTAAANVTANGVLPRTWLIKSVVNMSVGTVNYTVSASVEN